MKSKQSTFQASPSSKRSQLVNKPVKKQMVSSIDYGTKSAALDSALVKAETTQLESYIRSRSQFLDVEIDKLRNKLHAPLTKGSGTEAAGTSNAHHEETENICNSGSPVKNRSRTRDDTKQNTCITNQTSPNTAEISAIGQGMSLNSKGRSLDDELGYLLERSSRSPHSPGLVDGSRRKNESDNRLKNSDVNRRARIGEKERRNTGRGRDVDSSDDSDLSDGYSRARTNDRIAAEERRTDNKDEVLVPKERSSRAEHSEATQMGRMDDEDDVDVPGTAGTALANLFDRIARGKSDSISVTVGFNDVSTVL
jgi:hypothetical protein